MAQPSMITGFLLLGLSLLVSDTDAQTLEIEAAANKTDILTGEGLTYTLKYKCASTTMNCTNVTMTATIPSGIYFPGQNIGLTSDIASYSFSVDRRTVTFVFKEPLIAGNTGIIEFNGTSDLGLPNNTPATLTAQILSGGTPTASATVNTTLHSSNSFCPSKFNGLGLAIDNTTVYKITLSYNTGYSIGTTNAGPVMVTDQLPTGAIIDSVVFSSPYSGYIPLPMGTCTIDNALSKFTCNVPASSLNILNLYGQYSPFVNILAYVRYPAPTFTAGQDVTNSVTVTHTPEGGSPITITNGNVLSYMSGATYAALVPNTCTSKLDVTDKLQNPAPQYTIGKSSSKTAIKPGESGYYQLTMANKGNVNISGVLMEDIIPADINIYQLAGAEVSSFYNLVGGENVQHWYKTANDPTYRLIPGFYFSTPVGDRITGIKVTADFLPPAANNGYGIYVYYTASSTTVAASITNCVTGSSTTPGVVVDDSKACNTMTVLPLDSYSTLGFNKWLTTSPNSQYQTFYEQTQIVGTIAWSLLSARVLGGGLPLQMPKIMDLLPKGLDYDNEIQYRVGTPTADLVEIIPNYNGTGRTLVRLSWNTEWLAGSDYMVNIKTKVNTLAVAGNNTQYTNIQKDFEPYTDLNGIKNTAFFSGSSPAKCEKQNIYNPIAYYEAPDLYDVDGDGLTTIDTICHASAYFGVASSAQLESIKWVKGQCDADYSRYPAFGNTMPGGLANYKLIVRNNGNVPAKNFEIIDILPWVGDKGVIDPNPRLTDWRPNLVTPFTTPPGVVTYYSTEKNPCRTAYVAAGPAGCSPANWSTILPQDPTTVQSIKLDFGTKILNPGDQVELTWDMRAPVNGPTNNEIAWNSFAYKAVRSDNNDAFLPSEPFKVGIKLKPNQPGNYGNYIWLDANKDGIQDTGEAGIDGVRVELYLDNGDGINNPKTDQLTSFTSSANGGLYLFPAIPVGDYYAVFFLPPGYSNSPSNATADDKDSDGIPAVCNGNRVMITPITTISSNETDLTWDQGVFPDKAAVGNYVWFDENQNNIQDESSANGLNGVKVCLYKSDNTLVATDTTSNDIYGRPGYYLFDQLDPGSYYVQFKPTADKTYTPNSGTVGGSTSDETDSDVDSGTGKTATFTLVAGQVDLTWDAGFIIETGLYKLGNYVWIDADNNGKVDIGELGLNNVRVNLYNDRNNDSKPQPDEFVTTTLTATVGGINGIYSFERLPAGSYIVQIPDANFLSVLKDYTSSTGNDPASDPDDNIENDDNGSAVAECGVISKPITLGAISEPLEGGYANYTVDFGFRVPPVCNKATITGVSVDTATCTNYVANNDAAVHVTGIAGMEKYAYSTSGTAGLFALTATASTASSIDLTGITNPASATTYTFRIWGVDTTCYNDTTLILNPSVCSLPCVAPMITGISADTATCTLGVANSNAAVHVTGIVGMSKYAYSTSGTAGLFALTATASTASSIDLTGITNPASAATYTFRIWGVDTTCYNDTTLILNPSVCPLCSITATFTQGSCNNNGTTAITTDDYFTVTVSAVSATNGGTSGKYEVVLNGTVLNTGGTSYSTSVTVGTATTFKSDGTTTYQLIVRDIDKPSCETTVFTTASSASCSVVGCKPQLCIPVTVTRAN